MRRKEEGERQERQGQVFTVLKSAERGQTLLQVLGFVRVAVTFISQLDKRNRFILIVPKKKCCSDLLSFRAALRVLTNSNTWILPFAVHE